MIDAEAFLQALSNGEEPEAYEHQTAKPSKASIEQSNDKIAQLRHQLLQRALAWLAVREHGDKELLQKWQKHFNEALQTLSEADWQAYQLAYPKESEAFLAEYEPNAQGLLQSALAECRKENWQSDERYVESFVNGAMRKGQGPNKIRQTLQQRTSRQDLVSEALAIDDEIWRELITEVLEKKYGEAVLPKDRKEQARRMRFLQSRGFSQEQIWRTLRH